MDPDSAISPRSKPTRTAPQTSFGSSRKRSRDESSGEYSAFVDPKVPRLHAAARLQGDEGMADTDISNDIATSRRSQIQTHFEEQTEQQQQHQSSLAHQSSTSGEGAEGRRKFQKQEPIQSANTTSDSGLVGRIPSTLEDLFHESMTIQLGLGWKRISRDPDMQASARGWAKFVERRYPIDDVKILAKHTDGSFLGEARKGLYIFAHDLSFGAFIANLWTDCVTEFQSCCGSIWEGRQLLQPVGSRIVSESWGTAPMDDQNMDTMTTAGGPQKLQTRTPHSCLTMVSDSGALIPDSLYPSGNHPGVHKKDGSIGSKARSQGEVDDKDRMVVD